jgi:uncharacterized membrane protein
MVPFELVCNVLFIAVCLVLMGVGLVSLARQFVQSVIEQHERRLHQRASAREPAPGER